MNKREVARETQELLFGKGIKASVYISPESKKGRLPPSIILMQTFATLSAINLKPVTCKVLFFLLGGSEFENYIGVDILTLSEDLDISPASAKRAMKELTENGIVSKLKNPRDRRRNDYFIHPIAAWKGSSVNRDLAIQKVAQENQNSVYTESIETSLKREKLEIKNGVPLGEAIHATTKGRESLLENFDLYNEDIEY